MRFECRRRKAWHVLWCGCPPWALTMLSSNDADAVYAALWSGREIDKTCRYDDSARDVWLKRLCSSLKVKLCSTLRRCFGFWLSFDLRFWHILLSCVSLCFWWSVVIVAFGNQSEASIDQFKIWKINAVCLIISCSFLFTKWEKGGEDWVQSVPCLSNCGQVPSMMPAGSLTSSVGDNIAGKEAPCHIKDWLALPIQGFSEWR